MSQGLKKVQLHDEQVGGWYHAFGFADGTQYTDVASPQYLNLAGEVGAVYLHSFVFHLLNSYDHVNDFEA